MGLADVARRVKEDQLQRPGDRLFEYVRKHLAASEKPPMQPGDLVRASGIAYLCPREEVLANKYDVIRVDHKRAMLQITLDIGHIFHDLYRDRYFGPMGEWVGSWKCERCGWDTDKAGMSEPPVFEHRVVSRGKMAKMPSKCLGCGDEKSITFNEWKLVDKSLLIHGHPDGWSWRSGMDRVLVDLKSHGASDFKSRKKLRDGHDIQVWAYQHMCGDKNGMVWYLNKSPWGDAINFVREVPVQWDAKGFRSDVQQPVESLHNGLAGGPVPERLCISPSMPRAKDCQLADVCFG